MPTHNSSRFCSATNPAWIDPSCATEPGSSSEVNSPCTNPVDNTNFGSPTLRLRASGLSKPPSNVSRRSCSPKACLIPPANAPCPQFPKRLGLVTSSHRSRHPRRPSCHPTALRGSGDRPCPQQGSRRGLGNRDRHGPLAPQSMVGLSTATPTFRRPPPHPRRRKLGGSLDLQ
jgi:hypothetical protein